MRCVKWMFQGVSPRALFHSSIWCSVMRRTCSGSLYIHFKLFLLLCSLPTAMSDFTITPALWETIKHLPPPPPPIPDTPPLTRASTGTSLPLSRRSTLCLSMISSETRLDLILGLMPFADAEPSTHTQTALIGHQTSEAIRLYMQAAVPPISSSQACLALGNLLVRGAGATEPSPVVPSRLKDSMGTYRFSSSTPTPWSQGLQIDTTITERDSPASRPRPSHPCPLSSRPSQRSLASHHHQSPGPPHRSLCLRRYHRLRREYESQRTAGRCLIMARLRFGTQCSWVKPQDGSSLVWPIWSKPRVDQNMCRLSRS